MLEYDTFLKDTSHKWRRIDISEGIDVDKTNAIFVTIGFKYESMNHIFAMVVMI